jgi:hypothetical protein
MILFKLLGKTSEEEQIEKLKEVGKSTVLASVKKR